MPKNGLSLNLFKNKELGFNVKGYVRKSFMRVNDFKLLKKSPLKFSFRLDKGCYASIILNELLK